MNSFTIDKNGIFTIDKNKLSVGNNIFTVYYNKNNAITETKINIIVTPTVQYTINELLLDYGSINTSCQPIINGYMHGEFTILNPIENISIDKDNTTIVNGAGDTELIKGRVNQIKAQMETST